MKFLSRLKREYIQRGGSMEGIQRMHEVGIWIHERSDGCIDVTIIKMMAHTNIKCESTTTYSPEQWAVIKATTKGEILEVVE